MTDPGQIRRFLPSTRNGWALVIIVASLAAGTAIFLSRGSATAAFTYVLF